MTETKHTPTPLYYIRNKHSGFLGNAPFWWAKAGRGYTAYILGAERFNEKDAMNMVAEDPDKWEAYRCDHVDERLHLVFDNQDKKRLGTSELCGWDSGYAINPNCNSHDDLVAALENLRAKLPKTDTNHYATYHAKAELDAADAALTKARGE